MSVIAEFPPYRRNHADSLSRPHPLDPRRHRSRGALQARAADHRSAGRTHRCRRPDRWSTSAPTTTSASPTIPRSSQAAAEAARSAMASAWPRSASSAARWTSTASSSRPIARYLGKDDAILFAACFDANGGLFEPLLERRGRHHLRRLNHASIIDGVRLCKAKRYRFATSDMDDLETQLKQAAADGARFKLIVTDGVFSMDGYIAKLPEIRALADKIRRHDHGRRLPRHRPSRPAGQRHAAPSPASRRSTSSPAPSARRWAAPWAASSPAAQPVIDLLRQRARPYLFSNALAPAVAAGSLKAIEIAAAADDRREKLLRHTRRFRDGLTAAGFELLPGETPIIPVMLGEATLRAGHGRGRSTSAASTSPASSSRSCRKGKARIRTQMSAALERRRRRFRHRRLRRRRPRTGDHLMRALVKAKAEPGIWMEDRPIPEIGPEDVLVKVHKTGICGTDIHIYNWDEWAQKTVPVPMITGHEYAGEIVAIGAEVRNLAVGQRVSGEGHVVGMKSRASRAGKFHLDPDTKGIGVNLPGAFAEYRADPGLQHHPAARRDRRRDRRHPRSARQCRAHRAGLRPRRRGRPGHRRRSDRHHGRRRRPPCRRPPRGDHRHQPRAPGARRRGRRRRAGQRRNRGPARRSWTGSA